MADLVPTIVLAVGVAAAGAPDALRFLLAFAGRSPAVDVSVCAFAVAVATTAVLGAMLLTRHLRRVRVPPARDAAGAEEVFPRVVRMVALPVAFLVAACLVAAQLQAQAQTLDPARPEPVRSL